MGYYSRKALELELRRCFRPDLSYPTVENNLRLRLDDLLDRLEALDDVRPRNPMHPLYDRYFYESCIGDPDTVQGLLRAISEAKKQIAEQERKQQDWQKLLSSVRETGADPNGQFVLSDAFLSVSA